MLPDIFTEKEGAGASKTTVSVLGAKNNYMRSKDRVMIDVSTLSENGLPLDLVRPKKRPTDIVRPLAAQLMIDRTVDHFFYLA